MAPLAYQTSVTSRLVNDVESRPCGHAAGSERPPMRRTRVEDVRPRCNAFVVQHGHGS